MDWEIVLASFISLGASSGFWAYMRSRHIAKTAKTRLMMGMAYNAITTLGISYIERGWVTKDEYEELRKYYFEPYRALGGNGVAERVMNQVSQIPFRSHNEFPDIFRNRDNEGIGTSYVRVITREEQHDTSADQHRLQRAEEGNHDRPARW